MTDSTANLKPWSKLDLNDVLTSQEASTPLYNSTLEWLRKREAEATELPEYTRHVRPVVAEFQHALNRALFRQLGRADSTGTAEPESYSHTNEYRDNASRLESRIKEFLTYTAGWDGDDAEEIPLDAIYSSLNFLNEVNLHFSGKEPKSAAPSPDGEVVLYWHSPHGYAEVNFDGTGSVSMCWGDPTTEMELIEEEDENIAEFGEGRVWKTLSGFLQDKL